MGGGVKTTRRSTGGPPVLLHPAASRAFVGEVCTRAGGAPGGMEEIWGM